MASVEHLEQQHKQLLECLKDYLALELLQLETKLKQQQNYHQKLKINNDILKYEINQFEQELISKSIYIPQPCYDNIQRLQNDSELKLLSHQFDYDPFTFDDAPNHNNNHPNYRFIGQIVKKRGLSSLTFLEILISPSFTYLIKITFKKQHFSKQEYVEMSSKCRLGSIIEFHGKIEDYAADKLILVIDELILIQTYTKKGFNKYKETDKDRAKNVLCSHLFRYFVNNSKEINHFKLKLYTEFIPEICINSGCIYRHKLINQQEIDKIMHEINERNKVLDEQYDEKDPFHDIKEGKVARARFFGEWIVKKYGLSRLQQQGILDIAGGGGDLAMVLSEYRIPVTIIDPREPVKMYKMYKKLQKKKRKKLRKNGNENNKELMVPKWINAYFEWKTMDTNKEIHDLLMECAVVIGMHPDQATEPIVDVSLKYDKPFAILPCCVFPNLYPKYMEIDGKRTEVVSYLEFVEYLQLKNTDIKIDYLAFKGRNKILYYQPK